MDITVKEECGEIFPLLALVHVLHSYCVAVSDWHYVECFVVAVVKRTSHGDVKPQERDNNPTFCCYPFVAIKEALSKFALLSLMWWFRYI